MDRPLANGARCLLRDSVLSGMLYKTRSLTIASVLALTNAGESRGGGPEVAHVGAVTVLLVDPEECNNVIQFSA